MFSMIKPTLAAAIVLASASLALAEGSDSNPQNRYPHLAAPGGPVSYYELRQRGTVQSAPTGALQSAPTGALRSAPVRLYQDRNSVRGGQQDEINTDLHDRASSPYAPGGGN